MAVEKNDVNPGATPEGCVELLSSHEVARRLGISTQRARHLMRKKVIPGTRLGGSWVVPSTQLQKYIDGIWRSLNSQQAKDLR
jgi:excisionase family DNA binding protein